MELFLSKKTILYIRYGEHTTQASFSWPTTTNTKYQIIKKLYNFNFMSQLW